MELHEQAQRSAIRHNFLIRTSPSQHILVPIGLVLMIDCCSLQAAAAAADSTQVPSPSDAGHSHNTCNHPSDHTIANGRAENKASEPHRPLSSKQAPPSASAHGDAPPFPASGSRAATTASLPAPEYLHEQLLPVVLGLHRTGKLSDTIAHLQRAVSHDLKAAVRSAVERLLPVLLMDGVAVEDDSQFADGVHADQLQSLHHGAFMQLLGAVGQVRTTALLSTSCYRYSHAEHIML